ncbi:hypothetical protein [Cetobacterium sp.]|uniref:hypothetical protein n=1 Tax=Cetobacterium sp. TaxID=2071632 RepID=UPI003F3C3774
MSKIYIMDTNILCTYLGIKGKQTLGNGDIWNKESIEEMISEIEKNNHTIALPLPMVIEAGNNIGHAKDRIGFLKLKELLEKTFDETAPWHSFNEQKIFWEEGKLKEILEKWGDLIFHEIGLGDFMVLALKDYYRLSSEGRRYEVEIWSGDEALKNYEDIEIFKSEKIKSNRVERKSRN